MTNTIKLATLFSGIGSPEQGASRVYDKVETVFACEYDKFARQSYEANYNIDPKHFHEDVNDLDATQYHDKIDILVGGSPCQAFSIAGMRNGTEDERGQLIYQYIRVVEECKPSIIIYENVKGMLSIDNGRTIKEFVQALRDIGYHCHYDILNTKHYGVPQNRERFYLVGFLDADAYHSFSFAEATTLEKRLKDILEDEVDKKYYLSQNIIKCFQAHSERHSSKSNGFKFEPTCGEGVAVCLGTQAGSRPTDNFLLDNIPGAVALGNTNPSGNGMGGLVFDENYISPTLTTNKGEGIKIAGHLNIRGGEDIRRVYNPSGVSPTLTTMQGGNRQPKILQRIIPDPIMIDNYNNKIVDNGVSPTLTTNCGKASNGSGLSVMHPVIAVSRGRNIDNPSDRTPWESVSQALDTSCNMGVLFLYDMWWWVRKLTPRECFRLQDFPDDFKFVVSNSQLYKQVGNSMSVNILEMIFRQIKKAKTGELPSGRLF